VLAGDAARRILHARPHGRGSCSALQDDHDRELSAWLAEQGLGDAAILAVFGNEDLDKLDPDHGGAFMPLRAAEWEPDHPGQPAAPMGAG
jgi:hypothetical protein